MPHSLAPAAFAHHHGQPNQNEGPTVHAPVVVFSPRLAIQYTIGSNQMSKYFPKGEAQQGRLPLLFLACSAIESFRWLAKSNLRRSTWLSLSFLGGRYVNYCPSWNAKILSYLVFRMKNCGQISVTGLQQRNFHCLCGEPIITTVFQQLDEPQWNAQSNTHVRW